MAVAANKRSVMSLFSGASDIYSHQTRIVLSEKGVSVEITTVDQNNVPADLIDLNPNKSVPTLVDRDLVLHNARIIMEYLDERFPHPPLMPVYPVERGKSRATMQSIETEWYSLLDDIMGEDLEKAETARTQLKATLLDVSAIFDNFTYFMSEEFTLIDCYMAPLLWRLPELKITLDNERFNGLKSYMIRVFERESFQNSLTEAEREIRASI